MLDSSPVPLPPSRPLKRSASTASLPTPPRTLDKKKTRARSKHSVQDTDSESNYSQSDSDGEKEVDRVSFGRKKRRTAVTLKGHDEEEHENEFWMGRSAGKKQQDVEADDSDSSPALLKYRVKAPVSPPPSRRQTTAPEPPVTPPSAGSSRMLTRAAKRQLLRDSPENPFLEDSPPSMASSPMPRTPTQNGEKELMTYVFRGMKAQFVNPFYNLPPSERSLLPLDHPDYEANEACPPKLLFPSARRQRHRRHSPELTDEGEPQRPPKKLSKKDEKKRLELERTDSLRAGAVAGGKDDPLRRAQGPIRPTRR